MAFESSTISPARGFLTVEASLATLPPLYDGLFESARALGYMLKEHKLRPHFDAAAPIELSSSLTKRQEQLLFSVYAMLSSAYLLSTHEEEKRNTLPRSLAVPFYGLSKRLDVPPVLNYHAYVCSNFIQERRDPTKPESYTPLFTFSAPGDVEYDVEKRFIATHVAAEQIIAPSVAGIPDVLKHLKEGGDSMTALHYLRDLKRAVARMADTLHDETGNRLFYTTAGQYLGSFRGVVFDGVPELQGQPQNLHGVTNEQSPVPRAIQAFLGIQGDIQDCLTEYMAPGHRQYVEGLRQEKSLREYISKRPELQELYNELLAEFSRLHHSGSLPDRTDNTSSSDAIRNETPEGYVAGRLNRIRATLAF